ncbi:hypothetical protein ACFLXW_00190 [Candidatus Dependentiae bacterium]
MKKKIIALLFLMPTLAMSCQVVLINNGPYKTISVKDLNAPQKPFRFVKTGQKLNANFDPNAHARLVIHMDGRFYTVEQHACSKSHTIPLTTLDIEKGNGGNLLNIIKGIQPVNKK